MMQTSVKLDGPEKQIQFALRAYIAQLREVPERFEGDLNRGAVGSCTTTSVACLKPARYSRDGSGLNGPCLEFRRVGSTT